MTRYILSYIFILISLSVFGQDIVDQLELSNGKKIRGYIIEHKPLEHYLLKTLKNDTIKLSTYEIVKKEKISINKAQRAEIRDTNRYYKSARIIAYGTFGQYNSYPLIGAHISAAKCLSDILELGLNLGLENYNESLLFPLTGFARVKINTGAPLSPFFSFDIGRIMTTKNYWIFNPMAGVFIGKKAGAYMAFGYRYLYSRKTSRVGGLSGSNTEITITDGFGHIHLNFGVYF